MAFQRPLPTKHKKWLGLTCSTTVAVLHQPSVLHIYPPLMAVQLAQSFRLSAITPPSDHLWTSQVLHALTAFAMPTESQLLLSMHY